MARAFWKGIVSFGLVEIPVSLRPAVRSDDLHFSLLDREDFAPVGYRRYNKNTGQEVPWERVVRGYEYEDGEYVVLTDEEIRRANVRASQTIEILGFVSRDAIDPVFFDTPYFVEPLRRDSKSYALLRETLERTGRVAIARVVLRTRQHLAALHVRERVLVLNLLHYEHELAPAEDAEVPGAAVKVSDREVKMAERLVEGMTTGWRPSQYRDEYRDDLMALIEKKVKSGETHAVVEGGGDDEPRARREVMDLMPLLEKSLASRKAGGRAEGRPEERRSARGARTPRAGGERRRSAGGSRSRGHAGKSSRGARRSA